MLAENTDGRAIVNRNDMAAGMKQITRDASAYYLIGYNSSQAPTDGKFHEIKVRVKRPGVQVRARKGYWALTPGGDRARARAAESRGRRRRSKWRSRPSIGPAVARRVVRTWIGTSRGENGKTRVTFVWEPLPEARWARSRARAIEPAARHRHRPSAPDGSPVFPRRRCPSARSRST